MFQKILHGHLRMALFMLFLFLLSCSTSGNADLNSYNKAADIKFDILLTNGRVLDGSGNPWYYADIGIIGDRIVWMGKSENATAKEVIDVHGLYVSPGFIDVHSHAASGLISESLSHGQPLLAQGITTVIINPDGGGNTDIAAQRRALEKFGLGVNVAQLVPHGSVRRKVFGSVNRKPTPEELEQMKALVEKGMKEGAFGLSSGLFYTPGNYSETEEVIELAKVAALYNGVYTSHIRDESDYSVGLTASVDEVIRISREAGLPGIVTHIKALGTGVWGYSSSVSDQIKQARDEGVQVYADQYPYSASSTSLTAVLIPAWAREGKESDMFQRLDDPELFKQIRSEMEENLLRRGGPASIQIAEYPFDTDLEGLKLSQIAEKFGRDPIDTALDLIKVHKTGIISFNMNDDDVARFMRQSWTMTGSDGGLVEMGMGVVHPRNYGSFPRKISKYVQEDQIIELPFAIKSMTSLPASVFGMYDRGVIRPGQIADITVFNLEKIHDRATYSDPHQLSEGVEFVLVNGNLAVKNGLFRDELSGKVLVKSRYQ